MEQIMKLSSVCVMIAAAMPMAHAADAGCDRDCLRGLLTQYLLAMVAHTPGAVPVAPNMRFTEDTKEMKLGQGLWMNASGLRRYRQDILDVRQGVAATQVVVEENGMPVMLMLRMKVAVYAPPNHALISPATLITLTVCRLVVHLTATQSPGSRGTRKLDGAAKLTCNGQPAEVPSACASEEAAARQELALAL